jgi:Zn-finger nucleic acid-binding protein
MTSTLDCPRCGGTLRVERQAALGIGLCASCGGLWLSSVAARTVDAALNHEAVAAATEGDRSGVPATAAREDPPLPCPECREVMARWPVAGVEVDHCDAHGTFYDRAELKVVSEHLRSQALGTIDGASGPLELARQPRGGASREASAPRRDQVDFGALRSITLRTREAAAREAKESMRLAGTHETLGERVGRRLEGRTPAERLIWQDNNRPVGVAETVVDAAWSFFDVLDLFD